MHRAHSKRRERENVAGANKTKGTLLQHRDDIVQLLAMAQQLRHDFDLLPLFQEHGEGHSRHACHLGKVVDDHELLHEADGEVRILGAGRVRGEEVKAGSTASRSRSRSKDQWIPSHLQTVHSQATSRLRVALLQVVDDRVVHILLLLSQKVGTGCTYPPLQLAEEKERRSIDTKGGAHT